MRKLLVTACLLAPTIVSAEDGQVVGNYTHEFAGPNEVAWTVKVSGKQMQLVTKDSNTVLSVEVLTLKQRKDLWTALGFESEGATHAQAECVGSPNEYICHVPKAARGHIRVLKNRKTDYFHYDKFGGLMEIQKIDSRK